MPDAGMSRAEREELVKLVKARGRLAHRVVDQRAAELLADAERQLAARYKIDDVTWKELTANAQEVVSNADREIARRCEQLGIPAEFRPSLTLGWWNRGENMVKERRAELRKVAQTRIAAMALQARVTIESAALEGVTQLVAGGLESAEARAVLASLPTVEALMPVLDANALGPLATPPPTVAALVEMAADLDWK